MNPLPDIHQLLPQQAPFLLIDRLVSIDEWTAVSSLTVQSATPFTENGALQASGIIENIAQTCAAYIGMRQWPKVEIGVIGAIPELEIKQLPLIGETITTRICVEAEAWGMSSISATVCLRETRIATGRMKIALTNQSLSKP